MDTQVLVMNPTCPVGLGSPDAPPAKCPEPRVRRTGHFTLFLDERRRWQPAAGEDNPVEEFLPCYQLAAAIAACTCSSVPATALSMQR